MFTASDFRAACAALLNRGPYPVFYWRTPDGVRRLAAGAMARISVPAPCRNWRAELRGALRVLRGGGHPALTSGEVPALISIHFDPSRASDERWRDFPAVSVTIPLIHLHAAADGCTVHCAVPDLDLDRVLGRRAASFGPTTPEDGIHHNNGAPPFDSGAETYRARVRAALAAIDARQVAKLVIARSQKLRVTRMDAIDTLLETLERIHPSSYVLAQMESPAAAFISVTPERLARVEQRQVTTEAVAGTLREEVGETGDGNTGEDDADTLLLSDEKIAREHAYVSTMITAEMDMLCQSWRAHPRRVRRLRGVRHVVTPIDGTLREHVGFEDVIAALHPTPAVAGTPRETALRLIRDIEGEGRGMYAGVLGWIDGDGNGEAAVTIRSALLAGGDAASREDGKLSHTEAVSHSEALLHAGAGIVDGSDPEEEERETAAKLAAMRDVLTMEHHPDDAAVSDPVDQERREIS